MVRLVRAVLAVVVFPMGVAFAEPSTINVRYNIFPSGKVKSSVTGNGFAGYHVKATIPAPDTEVYTTNSSGNYSNALQFLYGTNQTAPRLSAPGGQQRVSFTVPVTVEVRQTPSGPLLAQPTVVNVTVEKTFPPASGSLDVDVYPVIDITLAPPPVPNVTDIDAISDTTGIAVGWTNPVDPGGTSNPNFSGIVLAVGTGSNVPQVGCVGPSISTVTLPAGSQELYVSGFGELTHNVRVCVRSRTGGNSSGTTISAVPGTTTIEAIRQIGLAPLGVNSQFLRVHPNGYYFNVNGFKEKWLLRGTTSPWSYLLPSGVLMNALAASVNPTNDVPVVDFDSFTYNSVGYGNAGYVYDHPTVLTSNPVESKSVMQINQLDSDFNFSYSTAGFFQNFMGFNEKWFFGSLGGGGYGWWIIEPSGLLSECQLAGSQYICVASVMIPSSYYANPLDLALEKESYMQSKYLFYRVGNSDNLNWGGRNEKWFKSTVTGLWYYIVPNGDVFRWDSLTKAGVLAGQDGLVFKTSSTVYANHLTMLVNLIP
jgi:hypothetical protein